MDLLNLQELKPVSDFGGFGVGKYDNIVLRPASNSLRNRIDLPTWEYPVSIIRTGFIQ